MTLPYILSFLAAWAVGSYKPPDEECDTYEKREYPNSDSPTGGGIRRVAGAEERADSAHRMVAPVFEAPAHEGDGGEQYHNGRFSKAIHALFPCDDSLWKKRE